MQKEFDFFSFSPYNSSFFGDFMEEILNELRGAFEEARKVYRAQEEATWQSLSKEQQLDVFCAVVRRIYDGEFVVKGTYRHILYDVFEFDYDSYTRAMDAGFLELHNSVVTDESWRCN
jgi:hypothetical protein